VKSVTEQSDIDVVRLAERMVASPCAPISTRSPQLAASSFQARLGTNAFYSQACPQYDPL